MTARQSKSHFITVWKAERAEGNEIAFKTNGSFTVYWGDGCVEKVKESIYGANFLKHKYVKPGEYTVSISSGIKYFSVSNGSDKELIEIKQWGRAHRQHSLRSQWKRTSGMFDCAENMICTATDTPDLSKVLDMSYMFCSCSKFNSPIEHWDTKGVKSMSCMLYKARMFNQPLAKMDLKAIEEVSFMLEDTPAFDQDLRDFKPKANTDNMFGWEESLAEHNEKYEVDEQRQDVYSVLKI